MELYSAEAFPPSSSSPSHWHLERHLRAARDAWKVTEPGKELERAKRSRTRLRKALKDCRYLNNIVGVAEGAVQSPVADLLEAVDSFINEDVLIDEVVEGVFEDEGEGAEGIGPGELVESANARLMKQSKLQRVHGDNLATASSRSCLIG